MDWLNQVLSGTDAVSALLSGSVYGIPISTAAVVAPVSAAVLVKYVVSPNSGSQREVYRPTRRPGWAARRRARGGVRHPRGRVGVGYASVLRCVRLSDQELAHHGLVLGAPGSGKTTFLELLIEANVGRQPVVILDPKGSARLAARVRALGGQVWTLDGKLAVDLLDPRPWQVPDQLLEAEDYAPEARVFRDAAQLRAMRAAYALAFTGAPMDVARLRDMLDRDELRATLEAFRGRDPKIAQWLDELATFNATEEGGVSGLQRSLSTLLDGVAIRGSLGTGPEALRLEDVIATNGLVLFSLDAADYPHATRKVGAWVLLAMQRLAQTLPEQRKRCLLVVDEVGALGSAARHLRGLVGRAREAGLACVLATQGPSDLEAVDHALLSQVLQDTAWQLAFRQGSPRDAEQIQRLLGQMWTEDRARSSDGRETVRQVERARVSVDELMNRLAVGDAWLRVAPVEREWQQVRVRVALPTSRKECSERALGKSLAKRSETLGLEIDPDSDVINPRVTLSETETSSAESALGELPGSTEGTETGARALGPERVRRLPSVPPECPAELLALMGADVLAKVERRFVSPKRELGPCLVWRDGEPRLSEIYGRVYDPAIKRSDAAHRVVYRRCFPDKPIPEGFTVDHLCRVTLCQRPDHFEIVTRAENTRRARAARKAMKAAGGTV